MCNIIGAIKLGQAIQCDQCGSDLTDSSKVELIGKIVTDDYYQHIWQCKCGQVVSIEFAKRGAKCI